jgi:Tfp pilus assembly protein PilF
MWEYFARRFGLEIVETLEPKPGIAPTTSHLEQVVATVKQRGVGLILTSPYFDPRHGRWVADYVRDSGAVLSETSVVAGSRTSTATAHLDEDLAARYEFDLVWDLDHHALPDARGLHVGSLGAALLPGRHAVLDLVSQAQEFELFVSYDPNVRPAFVTDPEATWRDLVQVASRSRLVKLSDEDLTALRPGRPHDELARELLEGGTTELVVVACEAAPMSLDGRAAEAYAMLAASLSRSGGTAPAVLSWAHALAGEIAARRGEPAQAERHFRVALAADAQDAYVRAAYADFLIEQRRPREAAAWVRDDLRNDVLLLRLALAEAAYADASPAEQRSFAQHRADLAARFAASRARGDAVHRREEARYALAIERDAPRALALARANWGVQREPADLYVLAQAAKAAGDVAALERVRSWQSEHRLEDATLGAITGDQP